MAELTRRNRAARRHKLRRISPSRVYLHRGTLIYILSGKINTITEVCRYYTENLPVSFAYAVAGRATPFGSVEHSIMRDTARVRRAGGTICGQTAEFGAG